MSGCCDTSGYRGMFNKKVAARYVRTFEKKGLDATAGPMVEALRTRGLEGASVLEIGAGSGTALAAMLESGATRAVGIDISPNYEQAAREFLAGRGHAEQITWHTGDFVAMAAELDAADVVFGNRVVCCYPFMTEMVDTSAAKAKRYLALAFPRQRWVNRVGTRLINAWMRLHRNSFRTFVHDPDEIQSRVRAAGFSEVAAGKTVLWHWMVWERAEA